MTKQSLNLKKEAMQKAALLQRITDVYSGAQGAEWDMENDFATAAILKNVICAFSTMFYQVDGPSILFKPHCIHHYDNPKSASEFLYSHGIRA